MIAAHSTWVKKILLNGSSCRNLLWTESIAVGDESFILSTKEKLGEKAIGRTTIPTNSDFELRETTIAYDHLFDDKKHALSSGNSYK